MEHWQARVEELICEAMQKGEFENLPGRGRPLELENDEHVPKELRMAYRMLRRAGIPPEEVMMAKNVGALRSQLLADPDLTDEERKALKRRLMMLDLELNMRMESFRKRYGGI